MTEPPVKSRARFQFELRHLIWVTVLLAASLGLFGPWGIAMAFVLLFLWWSTLSRLSKDELNAAEAQSDLPNRLAFPQAAWVLVGLVIVTILGALVTFAMLGVNPSWWCRDNLHRISGALQAYHQTHGSPPPAFLEDDAGRPAHSWRVLILPELGRQDLYDQYRLDEPWDSPHNRKLLGQTPWEYQCHQMRGLRLSQQSEPGMTTYLAVTGKHSAWLGATPSPLEDLADSPEWTALVVEAEFHPVPWTKPEDFSLVEVSRLADPPENVEDGHWDSSFLWSTFRGRPAIWADYDVDFLPPCEAAQLEELLTFGDGPPVDRSAYLDVKPSAAWRRVHYTNIARLVIFLLAAAWPIVWIVKERASEDAQPSQPEA